MYFNKKNFLKLTLKLKIALLFLVLFTLFFSCEQTESIFYGIAHEEKIATNNLHDRATILGMTTLSGKYFIATGGAMYKRNITGGEWVLANIPGGYEGVVKIIEVEPEQLAYVVFVKDFYTDISGYALYSMKPGGDNPIYKLIHVTPNDRQEIQIFLDKSAETTVASHNLIAMVGHKSTGWRYFENYQNANPELLTVPRSAGSIDTVTVNHSVIKATTIRPATPNVIYIATEAQVFTLDSNNNTLTKVDVKNGTNHSTGFIEDIYYSAVRSKLLVSENSLNDSGSYIWESTDGTNWVRSNKHNSRYLTQFLDINKPYFNGVVVGTRYAKAIAVDEGYFEINNTDSISTLTSPSGNKYTSGILDVSSVNDFYLYDLNGTIDFFVLTNGSGLWRGGGVYTAARALDWALE